MKIDELLEMLKPALLHGCVFEIYYDAKKEAISIDLNTEAKSGCVLSLEEDGIRAYMRYDKVEPVESFEDVLALVHDCCHMRSYFNDNWLAVFKEYNMDDPRYNWKN